MRIVIEMKDGEREALGAFCAAKRTTYSALIRKLLALAYEGKVPKLDETLASTERPSYKIELKAGRDDKPAAKLKKHDHKSGDKEPWEE